MWYVDDVSFNRSRLPDVMAIVQVAFALDLIKRNIKHLTYMKSPPHPRVDDVGSLRRQAQQGM